MIEKLSLTMFWYSDNSAVDGGDNTEDTAHNEKADDALETTNDKDTSNHEANVQNEPGSTFCFAKHSFCCLKNLET